MVRRAQVVLGLAVLVGAALAATSGAKTSATSAMRPDATSPVLDKAIAAQTTRARRWRKAPGVVGSGVGLTPSGRPVIEVFTTRPGIRVPKTLDGVPVRSVVTGMIVARSATLRYPRPVPIGVSTGLADFATGTLGARVSNGSSVYALSNNHVFAGVNMASIGDPILQPGPIEDGGTDPADRIATLADYQQIDFSAGSENTIDAAIALTTPADVGTATLPDGYGSPSSTTAPASVGVQVQKYGRTTGFTTGSINAVNVDVDVCYFPLTETICFPGFEAHYVNQFSITPGPFSASGDSGSLVVEQGSNQPVGLLFAGGDGLTIANPIDAVLQRFGVTIDGTPSGPGPPGAPTSLNAVPSDGQVALSWTAPSFDGGSQISGYRVYRGTSPNPTNALIPDLGTSTSFVDTGLQNGTTYYYKVSALNGNGAGPASNQASATPVALVPPATPLTVLDSFNRANENPLTDAGRWSNAIIGGEAGFNVNTNQLACGVATTCTAWRNNTQYGPDVEAYVRLTTLPGVGNTIRLNVRLQNPGVGPIGGYLIRANQLSGTDEIWLERFDNGSAVRLQTIPQEMVAGDTLLLRAKGTSIEVWRQPSGGSWSRLAVVQDATYGAAGYVGVGSRGTTGRLDDFGARSLGASGPPGAPTSLNAVPSDGQVALSWTAPSFDGGSQISGYRVYRGTSPNPTNALIPDLGTSTSFVDTGLQNGTTYYYKVSALNGNGAGPASNQASATPVALVPPATPLTVLDSFNRANENPLTDAGRWSNAIIGGEAGFNVNTNQLACGVATTCTAWRNNTQYGPDVEAYVRLTTLPGVGNTIRLNVRLQNPGVGPIGGYLIRANQLSGTDEIWLERFDNGSAVRLQTIPQEMVAGDTLLLRAKGTSIEVWRQPSGGSWSRLAVVQDATYGAAGYVGVGSRGTTGRLDDFGGRTIGAAPPDTTAPTDPSGLQANAVSSSQINLSWTASSDASGIGLYRIERCQGVNCASTPSNFSEIATVPGSQTSFSNTTGLLASTSYTYRVRAEDTVTPTPNVSGYSDPPASATTLAPPDTTAPTDPSGLQANAVSSSQINLSWTASSDASGIGLYRIERCQGVNCASTPSNFSEIATVPGSQTSFSNTTGLLASTSYTYRVRAEDTVTPTPNVSGYSDPPASATTLAPPDTTAPTDPSGLQANAVSSSQINLSWTASSDASGIGLYRIERCQGVNCASTPSNFSEIATVPGSQTSFSNTTGLLASTSYTYRVRAEDTVTPTPNVSGYSDPPASATTLAPPDTTAPTDPSGLQANAVSSSQINLSWTASSDASGIGLYRIERCQGVNCASTPSNFSEIATVPGSQTSFSNTTGLLASTSYTYRVRAEDTALNRSLYSNLASATTSPPAKPMYFTLLNGGTVGGVTVADEDVVFFNGAATFTLAFDGSDVGLASRRLDAFGWLDADSLLFSLDTDGATLPGVAGTIDDSDVVRFDASSLGSTTAGTFSMYFDGSDVGLTASGEDVDAFELLSNGKLVLSTAGSVSVTGVSGAEEDLLAFTPSSLGSTTSGTYAMYFDGSDVGLSTSNENVDAAAVDAAGRIYLSTTGNFSVTGASGADEDVFVFTPTTLGATTSGSYSSSLYFDGSAFGLSGNDVSAIALPPGT